ncbi:MAG: 50S ribosomal protein L16 [Candidatus Lloydbacteria bacterium RIFCSPHIGHO2_01_FULL_41_20]|uniref:Large ribosomal subunit protein uL16 n=1 Tax=Candidatus Lloydbacteria bacterium RIFCSPHIGHO2_01_FULL_41_20 TaxID=1798657 RepID=A0A1G2CS57_9BACT|nr:MAG: 50S ribosomal protein L16 [Candidatus Lloydbacteria bacterium RIFCSPHIGHO2_01_FULL_41_20]
MLFPKKVKYRKWHKSRRKLEGSKETRGIEISFGSFGLKSLSLARIKSNQIESARRAMVRHLGKTGRMWVRIFPDRPFTQKAAEVPMGKGKGEPAGYEVQVRPGRVIFEVDGVTDAVARESLRKAGTKLPIKTRVVAREGN